MITATWLDPLPLPCDRFKHNVIEKKKKKKRQIKLITSTQGRRNKTRAIFRGRIEHYFLFAWLKEESRGGITWQTASGGKEARQTTDEIGTVFKRTASFLRCLSTVQLLQLYTHREFKFTEIIKIRGPAETLWNNKDGEKVGILHARWATLATDVRHMT